MKFISLVAKGAACFTLVASLNANALVLSVFEKNETQSNKMRDVGLGFTTTSIIGYMVLAGPMAVTVAAGVGLSIGVVLDGGTTDARMAIVDPNKHLNDLASIGVYSERDASIIAAELETMKLGTAEKLQSLGCEPNATSCQIERTSLQQAFGLSELTIDFLKTAKGVQN